MENINLISFFWLIILFFYVIFVSKQNEVIRNRFLKVQLLLVLVYNIIMLFVVPWKLPVELSTISYFVVPIIVIFNISFLKVWGVYASIISGFAYFLAILIMGNKLYGDFPPYAVFTSLYDHGALVAFAFITLSTTSFYKSERIVIWIGIVAAAVWALLLRSINAFTGRIFIYEVLDGVIIRDYFSNNLVIGYIVYYILLVILLILSANMVHILSNKLKKRT